MNLLPTFNHPFVAVSAFAALMERFNWLIGYIGGKGEKNPQESAEPPTPTPAGEQELLRVSRTEKGELAIFVQGQRRRHLREITDPQAGRETVEAIQAVLEFSKDWLSSTKAPSTSLPETGADQETLLAQLRRALKPSPLASPQAAMMGNQLPPLRLVDEIDDLVQQRLQEQPDLAARHIRLTTGATGGLRVYVGQEIFDTVDDISDPQVKALIQKAIREWESRQEAFRV